MFGFRVCASRLAASLVLPAHAVPSIRKIYHRKWDITLLTALGSGFLVLVKETLHGPSPGMGMDDLRESFSQYIQFSFGLFDRVQFGTRRMLLPKPFLCLASVFWSLLRGTSVFPLLSKV